MDKRDLGEDPTRTELTVPSAVNKRLDSSVADTVPRGARVVPIALATHAGGLAQRQDQSDAATAAVDSPISQRE
jgi:hypothetical protein